MPLSFFHSADAQFQGKFSSLQRAPLRKENVKGSHRCAISKHNMEGVRKTPQSFNKLEGKALQGVQRSMS